MLRRSPRQPWTLGLDSYRRTRTGVGAKARCYPPLTAGPGPSRCLGPAGDVDADQPVPQGLRVPIVPSDPSALGAGYGVGDPEQWLGLGREGEPEPGSDPHRCSEAVSYTHLRAHETGRNL